MRKNIFLTFIMITLCFGFIGIVNADEIITEAKGTVTEPIEGISPDMLIKSDDESKYTIQLKYWYLYESPSYTNVYETDLFEAGKDYALRVTFVAKEGYSFTDDTTFKINDEITSCFGATANREIIFYNVPKTYTVTFDTNGGSSISSKLVKTGTTITKPEGPIKEGYKFDNWYKDKSLTTKYDFTSPVEDNITLYANWLGDLENNKFTSITTTVAKTYTGKPQTQNIVVKHNNKILKAGTDYKISYSNNINAGTGTAKVVINGIGKYTGTRTKYFTINKANNTMTVIYKNKKLKYKKVNKKAQTLSLITVKNAKGTVSYKKLSGNKKITINSRTGKITVKKKTKKGTYKIKIKVTADGNRNYKALSKTITLTIKVK